MSAKIIITDIEGEKFVHFITRASNGQQAMRALAALLGRSARTEKTIIIGMSGQFDPDDDNNSYPTYLIRSDCVRSVRMLEDDEDEEDPPEVDSDGKKVPNVDDPDWWKK